MSGPAPGTHRKRLRPRHPRRPSAPRLLQRKCACGGGAPALTGDCDECSAKRLQRKLAVGASSDPLEVEADRVADQVLQSRIPGAVEGSPVRVQRMGRAAPGGPAGAAPPSVERVLATSGQTLEPGLRTDMEQRFGHDSTSAVNWARRRSPRASEATAYTAAGHRRRARALRAPSFLVASSSPRAVHTVQQGRLGVASSEHLPWVRGRR